MSVEPEIRDLLEQLKQRLRRRFGDRFDGLYLFGSRAAATPSRTAMST
jgi:hypothetical protein